MCCHLKHISHGTHSPCLAFKLLSDNCAWHMFAGTGWWQTQHCYFAADLVMPVFLALISGRRRQLPMPSPSCSLFTVIQTSGLLKFSKFPSAYCCYLLQRVLRCYAVLFIFALGLKQLAYGSVSTKLSLLSSTCNVLIRTTGASGHGVKAVLF